MPLGAGRVLMQAGQEPDVPPSRDEAGAAAGRLAGQGVLCLRLRDHVLRAPPCDDPQLRPRESRAPPCWRSTMTCTSATWTGTPPSRSRTPTSGSCSRGTRRRCPRPASCTSTRARSSTVHTFILFIHVLPAFSVNTPRGFCGSGLRHERAAICHAHLFIASAHYLFASARYFSENGAFLADACMTPRGPLRAATSRRSISTTNVPQATSRRATSSSPRRTGTS